MLRPRGGSALIEGYHSPQVPVRVRLNTNESPYGPSEEFRAKLLERISTLNLNRYPDRGYFEVRHALGEYLGVEPSSIFCANGSNEVLLNLLIGYGGPTRSAVTFDPTYSMYSQIAQATSTTLSSTARDSEFRVLPSVLKNALDATDPEIVILCTPNNPTGVLEEESIIDEAAKDGERLVIVDRAYSEFSTTEWQRDSRENIAEVRTFSKAMHLAGLRFGYLIASDEVVSVLGEISLPYHLNQLTQAAVLAAIECAGELREQIAEIVNERDTLRRELLAMGLTVPPSQANFLLLHFGKLDARQVWEALLEQSILVRDCSNWEGLSSSLRVTIGTPVENRQFLEALAVALKVVS